MDTVVSGWQGLITVGFRWALSCISTMRAFVVGLLPVNVQPLALTHSMHKNKKTSPDFYGYFIF